MFRILTIVAFCLPALLFSQYVKAAPELTPVQKLALAKAQLAE